MQNILSSLCTIFTILTNSKDLISPFALLCSLKANPITVSLSLISSDLIPPFDTFSALILEMIPFYVVEKKLMNEEMELTN